MTLRRQKGSSCQDILEPWKLKLRAKHMNSLYSGSQNVRLFQLQIVLKKKKSDSSLNKLFIKSSFIVRECIVVTIKWGFSRSTTCCLIITIRISFHWWKVLDIVVTSSFHSHRVREKVSANFIATLNLHLWFLVFNTIYMLIKLEKLYETVANSSGSSIKSGWSRDPKLSQNLILGRFAGLNLIVL